MRYTACTPLILALALGACDHMPITTANAAKAPPHPGKLDYGQDQYNFRDVGHAVGLVFATVISVRDVNITYPGAGAAIMRSEVVPVAHDPDEDEDGDEIVDVRNISPEPATGDHKGIEYILIREASKKDGGSKLFSLVQNRNEDDRVFKPGEHVVVQTGGTYQRILPAGKLPKEVHRPGDIGFIEE